AAHQHQPVLHHGRYQLGIHLAQHTVRLFAVRTPQPHVGLPHLEQQLDLPAQPRQNHHLPRPRQRHRHRPHHHRPPPHPPPPPAPPPRLRARGPCCPTAGASPPAGTPCAAP